MPASLPVSELVAALLRALDQLELRADQWVDAANARRANSLRAMTADRTNLALDLDLALARARDAEAALAELAEISARDVGTVIGEVQAILAQSAGNPSAPASSPLVADPAKAPDLAPNVAHAMESAAPWTPLSDPLAADPDREPD